MAKKFNKEKLKMFMLRRKSNTLGLIILTIASAVITMIASLVGFARTNLLAGVTILLVILCFIQMIRVRTSFRTIKSKALRKKRKHAQQKDA